MHRVARSIIIETVIVTIIIGLIIITKGTRSVKGSAREKETETVRGTETATGRETEITEIRTERERAQGRVEVILGKEEILKETQTEAGILRTALLRRGQTPITNETLYNDFHTNSNC